MVTGAERQREWLVRITRDAAIDVTSRGPTLLGPPKLARRCKAPARSIEAFNSVG